MDLHSTPKLFSNAFLNGVKKSNEGGYNFMKERRLGLLHDGLYHKPKQIRFIGKERADSFLSTVHIIKVFLANTEICGEVAQNKKCYIEMNVISHNLVIQTHSQSVRIS